MRPAFARSFRSTLGLILLAAILPDGTGRAEQPQEHSAPDRQLADELRLGSIGHRLATANAAHCERPEMLTGLILHELGAYSAKDRAIVQAAYDLTYGFGVRKIIPGSAADRAGMKDNDEIIAVNGKDLRAFRIDLTTKRASYDRTERFVDLLAAALHDGPAELTVRRAGAALLLSLTGERGCSGHFVVMPGRQLNAWADGRYVSLTSRMIAFAGSDDELSFVIAHEMAHNILGHENTKGATGLLAQFGIGAKEIKLTELEADAYAIRLMDAAGYDPSAARHFLHRFGQARWLAIATTHPGTTRRTASVDDAIAKLKDEATREPETQSRMVEPLAPAKDGQPIPASQAETRDPLSES